MGYLTILLEGGPLDGGRIPMTGGTVRYGHILELTYTEVTKRVALSDYATLKYSAPPFDVQRREAIAIYKCTGSVLGGDDEGSPDSTATFVGVLR